MSAQHALLMAAAADDDCPFMAFVCDAATREVVADIAADMEWRNAVVEEGGIAAAIRCLESRSSARRIVIDLSDSADPGADITALTELCEPGTSVLALGTINDVALFRALIDAGFSDYLVKPISKEALSKSLRRVDDSPDVEVAAAEKGRLVTVIGARGGVGASTVAINGAWLMAHERGVSTALVDFDLQFGTAALALDLEPGRGLSDVLRHAGRIDGLFIERAMTKESENFSVLGAEDRLDNESVLDPAAVAILLSELRKKFACTVVDLPRHLCVRVQNVLAASTEIAIVVDASVAGVRDCIRLCALAERVAPDARVSVIANRVGAAGKGEISKAEFERGVERGIDYSIRYNARLAATAINAGKSLAEIDKNTSLVKTLRDISGDWSGADRTQAAAPWRRWIRKG